MLQFDHLIDNTNASGSGGCAPGLDRSAIFFPHALILLHIVDELHSSPSTYPASPGTDVEDVPVQINTNPHTNRRAIRRDRFPRHVRYCVLVLPSILSPIFLSPV